MNEYNKPRTIQYVLAYRVHTRLQNGVGGISHSVGYLDMKDQRGSGGSMLGSRGHRPPNLAQGPQIFNWFYSNAVSRCCLPNDEGSAPPPIFFPKTATAPRCFPATPPVMTQLPEWVCQCVEDLERVIHSPYKTIN